MYMDLVMSRVQMGTSVEIRKSHFIPSVLKFKQNNVHLKGCHVELRRFVSVLGSD
jgi:hypothetical protein